MGINWALGLSVFGIAPERPLRSLLIQAENDLGDCSEMFQGSANAMGIEQDSETYKQLKERFVIVPEKRHTGESFTDSVRYQIAKHKPDLVWFDPLLSFVGDDISRQDVCSRFLRQLLNPIADETGVIWMIMHHTPKPSADPKSKSGWNSTDHSYAGTGSSELTNWARAVTILRSTKNDGEFDLMLAKRGERARATSLDGSRTKLLHLKHAEDSILWEQRPTPMVVVKEKKEPKAKKPKASERGKNAVKNLTDLDGLIARVTRPMSKTEIVRLAIDMGHGSYYLANKYWDKIESRLYKNKDGLFLNHATKT